MKLHRYTYLPLALASTTALSGTVHAAAGTLITPTDTPTSGLTPTATTTGKFSEIAQTAFSIFLWVATAAAVVYLVLAGFQYITAGGDPEKATKARGGIINAIIGIIVIMAAFFILNAAKGVGSAVNSGTAAAL